MVDDLESKLKGKTSDSFKSLAERKIADFLDRSGIRYTYEPGILVMDRNKPKIWHPDFYLPEFGVYLEYYGLAGNREYDKGITKKTRVYSEMGLEVIALYPENLNNNWQGYLVKRLQEISEKRLNAITLKYPSTNQNNKRNNLQYGENLRFPIK